MLSKYLNSRGLFLLVFKVDVTICGNLHVLITFYWPYVSGLTRDMKSETFPYKHTKEKAQRKKNLLLKCL